MKCSCNGRAIFVNIDNIKYVEMLDDNQGARSVIHFIDTSRTEVSKEDGEEIARLFKMKLHPTVKVKE